MKFDKKLQETLVRETKLNVTLIIRRFIDDILIVSLNEAVKQR